MLGGCVLTRSRLVTGDVTYEECAIVTYWGHGSVPFMCPGRLFGHSAHRLQFLLLTNLANEG